MYYIFFLLLNCKLFIMDKNTLSDTYIVNNFSQSVCLPFQFLNYVFQIAEI